MSEHLPSPMDSSCLNIFPATLECLDSLVKLEETCFTADRISRRSLRRFIMNDNSVFLVATKSGDQDSEVNCLGYLLILFYRGTRLGRLYSIAVSESCRGQGIAKQLMQHGEREALKRGALYFRLEVSQQNNGAIQLYQSLGFKTFGKLLDYYDDHSDAFRMQKTIRSVSNASCHLELPWFRQSTPFTCGPAALMMAMSGLNHEIKGNLAQELELWREATTVYMTSGHGGCHPLGLALAAKKRGFNVEVWLNQTTPLFVDGVRDSIKKQVIESVHETFVQQSQQNKINIHYDDIQASTLKDYCDQGKIAIVLISTYRMDKKKSPHWVVVSGYDERCFYLHDPDPTDEHFDELDCRYLPIAHEDFEPMSVFGNRRLRTAIIISND